MKISLYKERDVVLGHVKTRKKNGLSKEKLRECKRFLVGSAIKYLNLGEILYLKMTYSSPWKKMFRLQIYLEQR